MTDPRNSTGEPEDSNQPITPLRRERAPTITIDTSAINPDAPSTAQIPPLQVHPTPPQPSLRASSDNADRTESSALLSHGSVTPSERRSPGSSIRSFASSEARDHDSHPTSPHNFSSPASKMTDSMPPSNYLAVPGTRSRGNSLESEGTSPSSSSYGGDTYVPDRSQGSHSDLTKDTLESGEEALKPDPGREEEFEVSDNKFAFSPGQLNKLINPKNLGAFYALGGLRGLEKGLRTDISSGLSVDETILDGTVNFEDATAVGSPASVPKSVAQDQPQKQPTSPTSPASQSDDSYSERKRIYGPNRLPEKKAKTILELAWIAYNDKVLILLTIAAAISLALGIYQSVAPTDDEARVQWVEGVAIIVAILIVVIVGAANDWQKERQFVKLNKKKDDRNVKVVRSGKTMEISVFDVQVGEVMNLEPGDLIPVDGIFIHGYNVKCDESSATGESDVLRKTGGNEVYRAIEENENLAKLDPFIISGAKVSEGVGKFLVTGVGMHSSYGKTMMSLQDEGQTTPLQYKLNILAEYIAKLGLAAGLLLFVVCFIKFLAQLHIKESESPEEKGRAFLQIFIVAVTVVVVAVPEGLPLAVTLALAFATTRMLKDNNLVRLLRACETMGNATTICSDKTGTLTENKMSAVTATLGTSLKFGENFENTSTSDRSERGQNANGLPSDLSPSEFASSLCPSVKELLLQSIVLNSTAFEGEQDGKVTFVGSKTETALLGFARTYLGMGSISEGRSNVNIVQMVPFDSGRKCMAVIVKLSNGKYRMLVKGASEILAAKASHVVDDPTKELAEMPLSDKDRSTLNSIVTRYASRSLRPIGLLYRDFQQWPPRGAQLEEDKHTVSFDPIFKDMVMLGIFGIQDPLRPGVTEAVEQCQRAGVFVRMVTGDNIMTAKAIAQECGIYTPGGIAIEGPKFRQLSTRQMNQIIPRLQVVARSSPDDKKILVSRLKSLGETVAVTGDGTNDAQALKSADVGFSMGVAGTEVAKEASDIILMDDNFASIVKAMSWGRAVNDAVKKFLQFQLTVNITAVVLTFISAVSNDNEESVLTAVQLLWVNLIMDTFAALALATDPPTPQLLNRRPEPKSAPLVSPTMWKMMIGQSIYQLVVTFVLNFAGMSIFKYSTDKQQDELETVVFNTFVWMQIFNQWK